MGMTNLLWLVVWYLIIKLWAGYCTDWVLVSMIKSICIYLLVVADYQWIWKSNIYLHFNLHGFDFQNKDLNFQWKNITQSMRYEDLEVQVQGQALFLDKSINAWLIWTVGTWQYWLCIERKKKFGHYIFSIMLYCVAHNAVRWVIFQK